MSQDRELQHLRRVVESDPANQAAVLRYNAALLRVHGEEVGELLYDRERWNTASSFEQDAAIAFLDRSLGEAYEFVLSRLYTYINERERVANFRHIPSGLLLTLLPGERRESKIDVAPLLIARPPLTLVQQQAGDGLRMPSPSEWRHACDLRLAPAFCQDDDALRRRHRVRLATVFGRDYVVISVEGGLGSHDPNYRELMDGLIEEGVSCIFLDLSKNSFINSSGLGALVKYADMLQSGGGGLALINTPNKVRIVFEMLGLEAFIDFFDSEEQAYDSLLESWGLRKRARHIRYKFSGHSEVYWD